MADRTNTDPARMEKIVSLCKRRGFIFQSAEIYGGLNGCWDYGPMGVELKRNLKEYWWRKNVQEREDVVGMDGSILTHNSVLVASGHVGGFSDPMCDCLLTKERLRADQVPAQSGMGFFYTGAAKKTVPGILKRSTPFWWNLKNRRTRPVRPRLNIMPSWPARMPLTRIWS